MHKICPRCGSKNVKWIIPQNWSQWVCYECDYTGPIMKAMMIWLKKFMKIIWNHLKKMILSNSFFF